MAGEINVSRYGNNEIIHGDDINYGETRAYENLTSILKNLAFSVKDVVIQGGIVKERGTPSMNVDIEPILAFCVSTGKFVYYGTDFGPVAVTNGDGSQDRYDTLEVRLKETTFDEVQRAYKDPNTGDITYQNWKTKIHYELEAQVIVGTPGAGVAPNHTAGWIKIAEIFVETAESTSILNADIENVDAGYDTEANSTWTAETDATFRTGALTEVKEIFRVGHKESGTHEDDVIGGAHVDWGAGAGEVDGDLMPLGTTIVHAPTGGTDANLTTVSTVRQAVQKILDLLIDLSGVENDALDSRHIAADAIDDEHINWGTGGGQVSAVDLPIADADGYYTATEVEAALKEIFEHVRDTKFLPIGAMMLYDGSGWTDNFTMPDWYACIVENAGQGCPNMVDRFAMGKVIAGSGSLGGSNVLIDHTHSAGNQSVSHKHDIGSHGHDVQQWTKKVGTYTMYDGSASGDKDYNTPVANYYVGGKAVVIDLGETGNQKTSHNHPIGSGSAPGSTNSRPQYYSMVYIRKCA